MRRPVKPIVVAVIFCGFLTAQTQGPERKVEGNVITSAHDPRARIRLPKSAEYAGADRWVLYGVADCELHAFVEADRENNVQRLYWVQFEGYVAAKPELTYQYDSPRHARLGGMDFYVDTWVRPRDAATRSGSDREHIEALLRAKGFKMPAGMMYVRLVHLLDEQKRRELMIVYGEDLAPTGLIAADLGEGGNARDRWEAIDKGLVERAQQKIAIEDASKP
jgi:hypothetical protein